MRTLWLALLLTPFATAHAGDTQVFVHVSGPGLSLSTPLADIDADALPESLGATPVARVEALEARAAELAEAPIGTRLELPHTGADPIVALERRPCSDELWAALGVLGADQG